MNTNIKSTILLLICLLFNNLLFSQTHDAYRIKIGNTEVYSLLDGTIEVDAEKLFNDHTPGKPARLLTSQFINNPVEISINVFLVKTDRKLILVDTGSGELLGTTGGHILESLASVGIKPEAITDILLTHIHADHSGGLMINNKKVFPDATIHVNKKELDFWLNETNAQQASKEHMGANPQTFENAKNMLTPYLNDHQVKTFEGVNTEVLPHIYSYAVGGHTPGHTIYLLKDGGEELFFWGDVVHVAAIQLSASDILDHFDVDHHASDIARKSFLKQAADKNLLIAGAHISFPGLGRLKKEGKKYIWYPVPYSTSGRYQ
ncbi:ribonuclease Z [Chryseobacterium nakagawai]|uniref:MBL fold metallo-hydrolase n=1 Tax=Chryseobacterium nakagawai TaxID=1241982 RepID=A0AAD0YIW2_CHRNA|nr:MBL fold metallo-hydrolase [Chryseobacterium nakagawai]AZA90150.1 MBL fold metallo-hydrolase [Chryseobacterium nakagawai]VEH21607.1 ribonuclease Z [Chryseobacterium nakagawai]